MKIKKHENEKIIIFYNYNYFVLFFYFFFQTYFYVNTRTINVVPEPNTLPCTFHNNMNPLRTFYRLRATFPVPFFWSTRVSLESRPEPVVRKVLTISFIFRTSRFAGLTCARRIWKSSVARAAFRAHFNDGRNSVR